MPIQFDGVRVVSEAGVPVNLVPSRTQYACGANVTPTQIAAGAGRLTGGGLFNFSAASRYIRFYDKATAPVVGTDVPILVCNNASAAVFVLGTSTGVHGIPFTNGLWVVVTVNATLADATVPAANDVVGSIVTAA